MTHEIPNDADMPKALAELMGWTINFCVEYCWWEKNGTPVGYDIVSWQPMTDRNHSRLAVEECERLGLMDEFSNHIDDGQMCVWLATPAQESRAAYLTLKQHRQQKEGK